MKKIINKNSINLANAGKYIVNGAKIMGGRIGNGAKTVGGKQEK